MATAPPPPGQLPVQSKKKGRPVLWVILIIFVGLVVIASLSRSGKDKDKTASALLLPTSQELQEAQKAGLSKDFATQGWILHRYAMNKYPPLLGMGTDEGLTIPSDEDLRSSLTQLKSVQQSEADKIAFQRMTALLWATHTANQLRSRGAENPVYKQVFNVASDCFAAVNNSFAGGTGLAAAPAIHRCLNEAPKVQGDMEKQSLSNWQNP